MGGLYVPDENGIEYYFGLESGFLIVKNYSRMYRDYAPRYKLTRDIYGVPRIDRNADEFPKKYRGTGRNPLMENEQYGELAEIRLAEIRKSGKCSEYSSLIWEYRDALDVYSWVEPKEDYEIICARVADTLHEPPLGFMSVGFEPTYFDGDHFSAIADCMFFPEWHGTDFEEGTLFLDYYSKLNQFGLFDSALEALEFTRYYISFDWTETPPYAITETFIQSN